MRYMFYNALRFNQNISGWDVSNVTDMDCMFYRAYDFFQDLSSWRVKRYINVDDMFNSPHMKSRYRPKTI